MVTSCWNKVEAFTFNDRTLGEISQTVPCGYNWNLQVWYCEDCEEAMRNQYPQGWKAYAGDTCKHGVYVGGCMEDYMCIRCELGDDS
jgi:hypothetical protein